MPDAMGSIGQSIGLGGGGGQPGAAPGMTQPQQGGGGFDIGSMLPLVLGPGSMLASKLIGRGEQKDIDRASKNIRGTADTASAAGKAMVERAQRGELTDPQQAQVNRMKAEQNAKMQQAFSKMGIPVSTMQAQAGNLVEENAAKFANDLINQSFDQGLKAMGMGSQASQVLLQGAMQQKKDLAATIGEVSKEIGRVFGTKTPPGQTPPTASASVPEEWRTTGGASEARPWDEDLSSGWA